jgi:diguanylate cyclase (GGDEF)-like protein
MPSPAPSHLPRGDAETQRVAALEALELMGSAPEREFDAITGLAATLFNAPMAAVTLLDRHHQWAKSAVGASEWDRPRDRSFCTHTIQSEDVTVVPDADADPRFDPARGPDGEHGLRFYAGTPIHAPTGERIGALCVADTQPREFDDAAAGRLRELAMLVDALVAARATTRDAIQIAGESARQAEHLQRQERVMLQAERLAMIGSWRLTIATNTTEWSDNTFRIHGLPIGTPPGVERALDFYPPHARAVVTQALATTMETGAAMDVETDFVTAAGLPRKVRAIGELECQNGVPVAVVGIFQDVTERWTLEQQLRRSADRDELTGIANRAAFNRELEAATERARETGEPLLLALVDLDAFKDTNDTLGHLAGDDVLKAVGRRLEQPWLDGTFAARLGGDEFALLVTDEAATTDPLGFAERLERELAKPVPSAAGALPCQGTVGTALFDAGGDTMRDLVHRADTELYAAKRQRTGERRRGERRAAR